MTMYGHTRRATRERKVQHMKSKEGKVPVRRNHFGGSVSQQNRPGAKGHEQETRAATVREDDTGAGDSEIERKTIRKELIW